MSHYGPGPRWVSGFSRSPLCHGVSSSSARHARSAVGVIAVAAQRAVGRSWKPTAVSMRPFLVLPLAIASDAAQVLSLPLRSRRKSDHFETMDIDGQGYVARHRYPPGARALAVLVLTFGSETSSRPAVRLDCQNTSKRAHRAGLHCVLLCPGCSRLDSESSAAACFCHKPRFSFC